jgi:hypothetical protein
LDAARGSRCSPSESLDRPELRLPRRRGERLLSCSSRALQSLARVRGIAVWVDDPSLTFTPLGDGLRGLSARSGPTMIDKSSPDPLVDFALLQSMTRAGPPASRVTEATRHRGLTLLGFFAPTAHEVAGSDLHRACLTRLCCVFRLPRPPDAFFPPSPCRSCFVPAALVGFALQRVSLPIAGIPLGTPCPSWRSLSTIVRRCCFQSTVADSRVLARSVVRVTTRRPLPTLPRECGDGVVREDVAGFERAFRGFSSYRKSVLRSAGVTPHDGSRSSPGIFSPPGVSPSSP